MSLGRTSTFIDIYAERDLKNGTFTEEQIQEFVDHFIMKLRMVKFARTPEYNALFSGDPTWVKRSQLEVLVLMDVLLLQRLRSVIFIH